MNSSLICLPFVAVIAFCLSPSFACAETNASSNDSAELQLSTERVIVFKDGYCLIVKKGKARTDAQGLVYSDEVPNSAILGSFWAVPNKGTIKSMVAGWVETETESKRKINCTNVVEVIKANLGKQCVLRMAGKDSTPLKGILLKLLSNDELMDPRTGTTPSHIASRSARVDLVAAGSSIETSISISGTTGSHFILRTEAGDMMLAANAVENLTIEAMESTIEQTIKKTSKRKRLSMNFGEPNSDVEISLMYFRPDVRWIPTYRINLTDELFAQNPGKQETEGPKSSNRTAEIFMQGELLNEAEDLVDVPFHVVVGVPNFRFRKVPSPMILESSLRNLLVQAAPAIMGGQSQMSNAIYTQRSGEFRSNRSTGNQDRAVVDLPEELSGKGGNDLFVYKLDKMTLKKGERATVPILRTEVAYRNIYTWDVQVTHAENYAASSASAPSPLVLSENKIWRQVELINDTDIPWTTGAAMMVDGFQPLAQELLTYTSPGGICRVPVTVSVDLKGRVDDTETKRELNALTWRRNNYAKVHGKTEIELANNKNEAVPVEINLRFGGKSTQASDEGMSTLESFRAEDWHNRQGDPINNSCVVRWKSIIQPGECFKPNVDYEFYLRY